MRPKTTQLILLLLFFNVATSQNLELSALTIPDSLSKNADAVVRFDDVQITLESSKKMNVKIKKAVTILNKQGIHNTELVFYYDKSTDLKDIDIITYNSLGFEEKKVKNKDIKDYSAADGFSIFSDNRLKYYKDTPISYPYTIYYEYEYETSNTAFIPRWIPIQNYDESIQNSSYKLIYPQDLTIQKSERNFDQFKVNSRFTNSVLSYTIENVPAIKYEDYSPSIITITPSVKIASNKFHLEGVDGYASNWNEFGKWMYESLVSPRMDLSEETKNKVKLLVKDIDNPIEKAKKVYEYVQNKTRYISIQVGIGGWMPMLASDVDKLGYGDCKGLTNYTKSLMDAVGVESYYTAVYAGNQIMDMEQKVPSVQGNHVFLYIPNNDEDIWLECTSQDVPFGYQGSFTDDRKVLVVSKDGGTIKHTGTYKEENSFQKTSASIKINTNNSLEAEVTISSSGIQYKNHYMLKDLPEREVFDHYKSDYWSYINNLNIINYNFNNNKKDIVFTENLKVEATDYATISGDRMLFYLNAFNRPKDIPDRYRKRKLPFRVSRGFFDEDEYTITLPDGYSIEALPENVSMENVFGKYSISIEKKENNIIKYTRKLLIMKGNYPKEEYNLYRDFKKDIAKHDNSKIVLLKN